MARVDGPHRRPRRHRANRPRSCTCPACVLARACWVESIAHARAAGVTLWQFALGSPALAESMVIITGDPERCADALNAETIAVPKRWPEQPMTIGIMALPPASAWHDTDQLAKVQALPRNAPLTAAHLRARGVRFHELSVGGSR